MRRFSSLSPFPDGRAGAGLLLLRAAAAVAALTLVIVRAAHSSVTILDVLTTALMACSATAVFVDFLTGGSAVILAAAVAWMWLSTPADAGLVDAPLAVLTVAVASATALLGPGAFSVDARIFGPREILVTRARYQGPMDDAPGKRASFKRGDHEHERHDG